MAYEKTLYDIINYNYERTIEKGMNDLIMEIML